MRIELFIFSTLSLWSLASMIYIRQRFFLRRNQLLADVQLTGVYSLNKQCTQLLLNKQDTFKIGLQRILYVVLDSSRHRPKAKSFRLLQHSIIDNTLNFNTLFFSMQTNDFFSNCFSCRCSKLQQLCMEGYLQTRKSYYVFLMEQLT